MLKVALLEEETVAKEIIFELGKIFQGTEWTFQYFSSISDFVKAECEVDFSILFIRGKYDVPRFLDTFLLKKSERIIVFTQDEKTSSYTSFERILYINKHQIKKEMQNIASSLYRVSRGEEEYLLSYNYVQVPIKYRDIFYIEKIDKQLIYHTQKGEFKERKNMKDAYMEFEPYDFLRIHSSYLVNMRYITKIDSDSVYLQKIALPFARNRKQEVRRKMESYIHKK